MSLLASATEGAINALPAYLPSPSQGVWNLGPLPLRAYALLILLGIVVAILIGSRRWIERGGVSGDVADIAVWAVPFGIVGARLYHVLTDWPAYFGANGKGFIASLEIWNGGLGIWGAVSVGALGAWIGARRKGILLPPLADAIAPGIVVAQAIGRWGNYFNQELFGAPTTLPWGLQIDPEHRPTGYEQFSTFHPTFLYESIWCLLIAGVLVWADKRLRMGHGRVFALYILLYCVGRTVWESLRIDDAAHLFGLRFNVFTSIAVGIGALIYLIVSARMRPGRETVVYRQPASQDESLAVESEISEDGAPSEEDVAVEFLAEEP